MGERPSVAIFVRRVYKSGSDLTIQYQEFLLFCMGLHTEIKCALLGKWKKRNV